MIRSILHIGGKPAESTDANQRRAGRIRCDGVKCSWGMVLNASATGMRIIAKGRNIPESGQTGTLVVDGPDGQFRIAAKVVWARQRNWGKREIGIQFMNVPPEARHQLLRLAEMAGRDLTMQGLADTGFSAGL